MGKREMHCNLVIPLIICQIATWEVSSGFEVSSIIPCRAFPTHSSVSISSASSSPQSYYSMECSGLERKLSECTWYGHEDGSTEEHRRGVAVLCKESEFPYIFVSAVAGHGLAMLTLC